MNKYKIIVDENISYPECFEYFGNVIKVNGREISNSILKDCDILIVRSVTKVDQELLKNTKVKFVGTATSGVEHIDQEYLIQKGIAFADAKGCNSFAVAEYVISAIAKIFYETGQDFYKKKIGIVGYGNIGKKLAKMCSALGMDVKINDPPLSKIDNSINFIPLNEILTSDIISLHVPLTFEGDDKTHNLLDENLNHLKENSILINTSRGGVVNEKKLLEIIDSLRLKIVTDVWINEPNINSQLLLKSYIATPHIAGYSLEGKILGTKMIFEKLNTFLKTNFHFDFNIYDDETITINDEFSTESFYKLMKKVYNIEKDSLALIETLKQNSIQIAATFDELRKNYHLRKSFKDFTIITSDKKWKIILEQLRFNVQLI